MQVRELATSSLQLIKSHLAAGNREAALNVLIREYKLTLDKAIKILNKIQSEL